MLLVRDNVPIDWVAALGVPEGRIRRVAPSVFDAASDVEHAQGVAAICDLPDQALSPDDIDPTTGLVLILDAMRDPGNMGTTLRSAAAAGVQAVLTARGCVDPMSPKVVRAGMGAHFRLRIGQFTPDLGAALRNTGRDLVYADPAAALAYDAYEWSRAAGLVVGGETEPLSTDLAALVTRRVAIPMQAGVESLNAGVAASVLLFEAQRQERLSTGQAVHVDKRA